MFFNVSTENFENIKKKLKVRTLMKRGIFFNKSQYFMSVLRQTNKKQTFRGSDFKL